MTEHEDADAGIDDPSTATTTLPDTKSSTKGENDAKYLPPYNVVILNDEEHTFDYVIELLTKLFRHPLAVAKDLTWAIHNKGLAVVYTTHKEKAELKCEQVLSYGPDPRMEISKGPLRCYIEPAQQG